MNREELERAALAYLNRFDTSASNLRRVLMGSVRRAQRKGQVDVERSRELIDEIVTRFLASGLLNDRRYAESIAHAQRRRGASERAIRFKLQSRGVSDEDASEALSGADRDSNDAELEAARALVRRRRLGPFRPPELRAERRQRDLGALARAGFSFEIARAALEADED